MTDRPLGPRPYRRSDFGRAASRVLYVQSLFTAERQQGPGFAFALVPFARRLFTSAEDRGRMLRRHLGFFGTHPLLAGYVLGIVARLEERRAHGEAIAEERIEQVKRAVASPLAALGDPLFWVTLRPLAGLVGIFGLLFIPMAEGEGPDLRVLICPLLALLTYNAVALPHRFVGVARGYAAADEPGRLLRSLHLAEWKLVLERASAFAFGGLVMLTLAALKPSVAGGTAYAATVFAPLGVSALLAVLVLERRPGRGVEIALLAVALALMLPVRG